ncbi:aromatic-ring-hydroxylating dioxygenase subunit beta [Variovorax guangxiensis]|uniref:aromatic-ring-hydroxylating dioxygenase subunit beta n=1 Tax=Variovorax guangxiensis TaxID=1775474 RepID=UPI00285C242A|nr:aromatic-ring-hydroxylating dioxygenase subunit beta [Variovorax guangxiensis]MDR6858684.1 p-cumate 2,3-dioxygenase beta subunit [Variovorax guangxiensis]
MVPTALKEKPVLEISTRSEVETATAEDATLARQAEAFLYHEAALLDGWRLDEWLALMAPDVHYRIPPLDLPDAAPGTALYLIDDDRQRLESRIRQLTGKAAWAETPRSRTRRLVTNVRVGSVTAEGFTAHSNFAVWRFQFDNTDVYVGRYEHTFVRLAEGLRLQERKVVLDLEALRPHGRISFIL